MIDARVVKRLVSRSDAEPFTLDIHLQTGNGITVLFGPSGAGKSLTLNSIAGFVRPDEGRILVSDNLLFDGATGVHVPPQRRRCAYIFQDHALFPHMTVRGNLQFAAAAARTGRLNRHRKMQELLEAFELTDLVDRRPSRLSGGQKQRAALARILMGDPRLLLLDEPSRGLDQRLRLSFHDILRKARDRLNVPMVLVTHDLEDCFELADSVCIIDKGRLLQSGTKDQVFLHPSSIEVARLLGIYNIWPAEIAALDPGRNTSRIRVWDQEIEGPYLPGRLIGDRGTLCVRRSETRLMAAATKGADHLAMTIVAANPSALGMRLDFGNDAWIIASEGQYKDLDGSPRVYLQIPRAAIYFLGK
ncbi:MAG: ABC transporter ATP-binding protein [Bryobacteraceae bacterium]